MDAEPRTPRTRLELAETIAAKGDLRRRMEAHLRYRFRLTAPEVDDVRTADDWPAPDLHPDVRVLLRQTLAQASPACRRLIRAHYLEGKTLKETAETLSYASSGVVWVLLDRCIRRLRAIFGAPR